MRNSAEPIEFTDASELLGGGIFILLLKGKVQYIGRTRKSILAQVSILRNNDRSRFLPRIKFDQVGIKFVHPDRLEFTYQDLVAELSPRYNTDSPPFLDQAPSYVPSSSP